jgi:hypothetical protein
MNTRRGLVVTIMALAGLLAAPFSSASWLSRTPAADREESRPLRELDLRAAMAAGEVPAGLKAALDELPERCSAGDVFEREDCDDALRCGWLAARARLALAWHGGAGTPAERDRAARRLDRAARRLAVGGRCGGDDEERARWRRDRRSAARDASLAAAAVWTAAAREAPAGAVEWPESRSAREALARVLDGGLTAVSPEALVTDRVDVLNAWERTRWLSRHPAIAGVRDLVQRSWKPYGGVPTGCGRGLWDTRLLEDGWRGVLVRKSVPEALGCLAERLPAAAARRGMRLAGRARAERLAAELARRAATDAGGREFPGSTAVMASLEELSEAVRSVRPAERVARARSSRPKRAEKRPKAASSPGGEASAPVEGAARGNPREADRSGTTARKAPRPAAPPPPRRRRPDSELVELARRVERLGLGEEGAALVSQARRARDEQQRNSALQALIVTAHRRLCAPLERAAVEDLDATRRVLRRASREPDEAACRGVDGRDALERLLGEAPRLRRLVAATEIRAAARSLAGERLDEAERHLDSVPEAWRGTTWRLVRAWAHRLARDPVSASEVLAGVDEAVLDRLRASGNESVARLVAHATVSRSP